MAAPSGARLRTALILLGGISLLSGVNAGLVRLGVWAPVASVRLGDLHGMVMVLGFMGTLISLERAQALRQRLAYLAPALLGAGSLALIVGLPPLLGKLLLFEGTLAFVLVAFVLWRRAPFTLVAAQVVAALCAALAAGLWLVVDITSLIPLLAAFLVITIAAERAELAQLSMGRNATTILLILSSAIAFGAMLSLILPDLGSRILGAACLATAVWLCRDDVGRRMIRTSGLRRYNAAALLAGNFWLALAGLTWMMHGRPVTTGAYDLVIHGTFLGFGMAMIMAHAPIIFPTVLGRSLPYRRAMWLPLVALQVGMVVRTLGHFSYDLTDWQLGGVITVAAVLLFALTALTSAVVAAFQKD